MLYIYAKNNLVMVNIYIKEPVVTRIWRDEKTPIIHFVAYTGGLLGLCMGFSLVSLFEIIYYTLKSLPWKKWFKLEDNRYNLKFIIESQALINSRNTSMDKPFAHFVDSYR